jgi:hypothetical protein
MKKVTVLQFDENDHRNWAMEIEDIFNRCVYFCHELHDEHSPKEEHPVRKSLRTITSGNRAVFTMEDVLNIHEYAASIVFNRMFEAVEEGSLPCNDLIKQNADRLITTCKQFTLVCRNTLNTP